MGKGVAAYVSVGPPFDRDRGVAVNNNRRRVSDIAGDGPNETRTTGRISLENERYYYDEQQNPNGVRPRKMNVSKVQPGREKLSRYVNFRLKATGLVGLPK